MNRNTIILVSLSMFAFSSCTKVVQLDLKSAHPQYVIEGNISNAIEGPGYVRITRSVNFNDANGCPPVSNASVVLTDDMSHGDTLKQTIPGYYEVKLRGVPGHSYHLLVQVDGKTFTASSTMPQPVTLDSLYAIRESPFGKDLTTPYISYHDPKGSKEYYNFIVYRNGQRSRKLFFSDDLFDDGLKTTEALRDFDSMYVADDHVMVEMQSISQDMYRYYYSLEQNLQQNAATPANPVSMIQGTDVVGYFSAHASQRRSITISGL